MKQEHVYFVNIVIPVVYYIGVNAIDNFKVIDMGKPTDYWFHAADISSCHVVVNIPHDIDNKQLKTIIKRGALICKQHTLKLKTLKRVEIIYTRICNTTKTDITGSVTVTNPKSIIC